MTFFRSVMCILLFAGASLCEEKTYAGADNLPVLTPLQKELQTLNDRASGKFSGENPVTVFIGTPSFKNVSTEEDCKRIDLKKESQERPQCIITKIGEGYYWASRRNTPLHRSESGIFVLFHAVNGSGYIKIVNPELKPSKEAAALLGISGKYDYFEHLSQMLWSIKYYGKIEEAAQELK